MQKPIMTALSLVAFGASLLLAVAPVRADLPPERQLLGIRMWRPANSVFAKFGAPSRQISSTSSSTQTMGGMPGMMGSSAGPSSPYSMMGSGGYQGAPGAKGISNALKGTGSTLDTAEEVLHALALLSQNKNAGPVQTVGTGMPGFMPGSPMGGMPGMGGSPYGGSGSPYGGMSPYGGSGPSSPYSGMGSSPYSGMGGSGPSSPYSGMGSSPYSGMGGSGPSSPYSGMGSSPYSGMGGSGPGMMGGMGGQNVSDLTAGQTRWFYDGTPEKVFTFNKDGRVIGIAVFAKTGILGTIDVKKDEIMLMKIALTGKMADTLTSRHIELGSTMAAVYKSYGWAAHVVTSGDVVLLDYRDTAHVAFKCEYFGKKVGYRVTGIVVSLSQ